MVIEFLSQTLPPNQNPLVRVVDQFHALSQATIEFEFHINNHGILGSLNNDSHYMYLLGCVEHHRLTYQMANELCVNDTMTDTSAQCHLVVPAPAKYWERLSHSVILTMSMLKCPAHSAVTIEGELILMQPDGKYLSAEFRYYPTLYLVYTMLWAPIAFVWVFLRFKQRSIANLWQMSMWVLPVAKLLSVAFAMLHYHIANETGSVSSMMPYLTAASKTGFSIVFFAMLFMFAKGLFVTRRHLQYAEIRVAVMLILGYSLTALIASGTNRFLWSLWMISFSAISSVTLRYCSETHLFLQNLTNQHAGDETALAAVGFKIMVYKTFRLSLGAFAILTIAVQLWLQAEYNDLLHAKWVSELLLEALQFAFVVALGIMWRVRIPNHLFSVLPTPTRNGRQQGSGLTPPPVMVVELSDVAVNVPHLSASKSVPPSSVDCNDKTYFLVLNPGEYENNVCMAVPVKKKKKRSLLKWRPARSKRDTELGDRDSASSSGAAAETEIELVGFSAPNHTPNVEEEEEETLLFNSMNTSTCTSSLEATSPNLLSPAREADDGTLNEEHALL